MEEEKKELEEEKVEQEEKVETQEEPKEEEKAEKETAEENPKIVKAFTETKDDTGDFTKEDIEENKVISLFAYIGLLFLVPLLGASKSRYARYHTNQGLVLFICEVILGALVAILLLIPVVGKIFSIVFSAVCVIFMVLGIVNAVQGKAKELPFIGKIKLLDYNKVEK